MIEEGEEIEGEGGREGGRGWKGEGGGGGRERVEGREGEVRGGGRERLERGEVRTFEELTSILPI